MLLWMVCNSFCSIHWGFTFLLAQTPILYALLHSVFSLVLFLAHWRLYWKKIVDIILAYISSKDYTIVTLLLLTHIWASWWNLLLFFSNVDTVNLAGSQYKSCSRPGRRYSVHSVDVLVLTALQCAIIPLEHCSSPLGGGTKVVKKVMPVSFDL